MRKGRFSGPNGIYFITLVTDQRIPWFQDFWLARIICRCLHELGPLCWVVMTDHAHLLLKMDNSDLSRVIKKLKAISAQKLNHEIGRSGRFWTPGFHDHGLRNEEDLKNIARYIVANPLRASLVSNVRNYPFWNAVWL